MIWFTSDLHLFHNNIITKFEFRPFKDIAEMNETIINNYNSVVTDNDDVYLLGDICFGRPKDNIKILKSLKGKKYLIKGNHDKFNAEQKSCFMWIKDYYKLRVDGQKIVLCHYPFYSWDGRDRKRDGIYKGSWHFHGHTHTNSHDDFYHPCKVNIGVDHWNYTPVSLDVLKQKIKNNLKTAVVAQLDKASDYGSED